MFTLESVKWLASPDGERVLARLAGDNLSDDHTLRLITSLRRDLSGERAGAALELARLRIKAVDKFGADASKMYFTRDALEQASDPLIRKWRSGWRSYTPQQVSLIDVCCGIGSDSLAFSDADFRVVGYDLDEVRVFMAQLNAEHLGKNAAFVVADVRDVQLDAYLIFYDPARRDDNGKRIFDVEQYQPPLSLTKRFSAPYWWTKLSPGVEMEQLQQYRDPEVGVWFISVNGDLKEAGLNYAREGGMISSNGNFALLLHSEHHPIRFEVIPEAQVVISEPRQWLIEPDPALIRAGFVADTALMFDAAQLDDSIAYLTSDKPFELPWGRSWRILDWMPFNGKKLKAYLRERNVGTVTVKKRGTAVTPETLIPQLKLKGSESRTLVLTRYQGQQIVLICEDYQPG